MNYQGCLLSQPLVSVPALLVFVFSLVCFRQQHAFGHVLLAGTFTHLPLKSTIAAPRYIRSGKNRTIHTAPEKGKAHFVLDFDIPYAVSATANADRFVIAKLKSHIYIPVWGGVIRTRSRRQLHRFSGE